MRSKKLSITAILFAAQLLYGQVGINTPNPEAALDIVSDNSGILIPRMTAAQIEQITTPTEGELVFSTTNTGTTVNLEGFWYYDGTTWLPIIANSSAGTNIYNTDGTLESNRVVNLNNHSLNFGPNKLFISGDATGNIGISTNTPTQKLDVEGGMRVRSLSSGNVFTTVEGVLSTEDSLVYTFGDIRYSSRTTDHNGWYLLNGRTLSSLPSDAQTNAIALGITGNLPNAAGRYIKQGTAGTLTGASSLVLTQANMPNFNLTGTTSSLGHSHSLISPSFSVVRGTSMGQAAVGTANVWQLSGGAQNGSILANQTYTSAAGGAHAHTMTIPSGGTATPLTLNPNYIQLNYFIYLGN